MGRSSYHRARTRRRCACLAVAAAALLACTEKPPPGSNVLLLIADDLGTEQIGAYGENPDAPPTPNIDALAARGVLFRRAYATSVCSPSRAALLTGRHPRRYGLGRHIRINDASYELPLDEVTLPEMLAHSPWDYDDAAVGKWHLASLRSPSGTRHPLESGFHWHAGSFGNLHTGGYRNWEKIVNGAPVQKSGYVTTDTVEDAIERMDAMHEPWLLWLAFNAIHAPLHVPPDGLYTGPRPRTLEERQAAMVEALDHAVGDLLQGVDPELLARTTIVFLGDNGLEEKRIVDLPMRDIDSKGTLYERGIRVPLIVSGPLVRRPGSESDALVHLVDVFPTVAEIARVDLAEIPGPGGGPLRIDGQSLLPYLRDPGAPSQREFVFQDLFGPNGPGPYRGMKQMLFDGRYKLIQNLTTGQEEFYDLDGRLTEGPDLIEALTPEEREAYERLRSELERIAAELDADRKSRMPELPGPPPPPRRHPWRRR